MAFFFFFFKNWGVEGVFSRLASLKDHALDFGVCSWPSCWGGWGSLTAQMVSSAFKVLLSDSRRKAGSWCSVSRLSCPWCCPWRQRGLIACRLYHHFSSGALNAGTSYVGQAGLKLDPSASWVLSLKACATPYLAVFPLLKSLKRRDSFFYLAGFCSSFEKRFNYSRTW